jgi:hypothetical protein
MIKLIGAVLFLLGAYIVSNDCLLMAYGRDADTSLAMLLHASIVLELPQWQAFIMWLTPMLVGFACIITPDRRYVRG